MRSELIAMMSVVSIQEVITQCRNLFSSDYREPLNNTSSDYLPPLLWQEITSFFIMKNSLSDKSKVGHPWLDKSHKYNIFLPRINPKNATANNEKKWKTYPKSCWWFCFDFAFYIYNWMFPKYPFMDLKRMWLYVFRHVSCLLPKSWEEKSCSVL